MPAIRCPYVSPYGVCNHAIDRWLDAHPLADAQMAITIGLFGVAVLVVAAVLLI
jgi:hypothetical protein